MAMKSSISDNKKEEKDLGYMLLLSEKDAFYLISESGFHIRVDDKIFNILKEKGLINEK